MRQPLPVALAAAALLGTTGLQAAAALSVTPAPAGSQIFTLFTAPEGSAGAHTADEPSIGADWKTGAAMYQSLYATYRVVFDDSARPAKATWTDVSAPLTSIKGLDPILYTDSATGRTIVSQLGAGCSISEFSDDDGVSWTPDEGCGPPSGVDHQTVGGGPFAPSPVPTLYSDAVYYCSHASVTAFCALSRDGGMTYGPGIPIYTVAQCEGLHGHVRVAPDGTAIVPNQNCATSPSAKGVAGNFANQAAVVSQDNGLTWAVHVIPGSVSTLRSDPAASADTSGRWYFAYENAVDNASGEQIGGSARVSMSTDDGTTWSPSVDISSGLGLHNVTFPEIIAGDAGRAAYAFLGSPGSGDPENQTFKGLWYLYVALTRDGGTTWTVQNLTPGDPVERGCIFLAGSGDCPSPSKRNLYDFMDITADSHGRVLIGYSDGCTATCVADQAKPCSNAACDAGPTASTDHRASIARLSCGRGLVAAQDAAMACPAAHVSVAAAAQAPPSTGVVSPSAPAAVGTPNTASGGGAAAPAGLLALAVLLLPVRRMRRH